MSWRHELAIMAAAVAILLAGAALGAAFALVARAAGTPTASAAAFQQADEERPLNP